MHSIAGSPRRARGFARIVSIRAPWNPAAGPSFCYASYPAAIPDSPNTRGCLCFPAPDTRKTRSMLIVRKVIPFLLFTLMRNKLRIHLSGEVRAGCPARSLRSGLIPRNEKSAWTTKCMSNAPGKPKLAAGSHNVVIKAAGFAEWKRTLAILQDRRVPRKPVLEPVS